MKEKEAGAGQSSSSSSSRMDIEPKLPHQDYQGPILGNAPNVSSLPRQDYQPSVGSALNVSYTKGISSSVEAGTGQSSSPSKFNTDIEPEVTVSDSDNKAWQHISKSISNCLKDPCNQLFNSSDPNRWSIFKVPNQIRKANEMAYEPRVISIGPYHHGKEHLKKMEIFKKSCLSRIIGDSEEMAEKIVKAMIYMKDDVRKCYPDALAELVDGSNAFVQMMILDGCFIVDLLQREGPPSMPFFQLNRVQTEIYCDLLLLENQLPFFVLSKLCCLINMSECAMLDPTKVAQNEEKFARSALEHLQKLMEGPSAFPAKFSGNIEALKGIKHLLGLVHGSWIPPPVAEDQGHLSKFIRCAIELEDVGIKFEKKDNENGSSVFDIKFEDAKLKIPTLRIHDNTESILRNLMAYEQFIPIWEPTYVCDYVVFMDNLMDSGKDVQLLRHREVIVNWLGDDEAVAQMFNKLRDFTYSTQHSFYYKKLFDEVNTHCRKPWNRYKAKLKKDYFNSPWSIISVIAAIVLLLLTIAQTIFSVLSYIHPQ